MGFLAPVLWGLSTSSATALPVVEQAVNTIVVLDVMAQDGKRTCAGVIYQMNRILTAAHCTNQATLIRVRFHDESFRSAQLVGQSITDDIAVLEVAGTTVKPAKIGQSSRLRIGDPIFVIGHPENYEWSVTSGVVSRFLSGKVYDHEGFGATAEQIQHDAGTRAGYSGGPVFNERGEVVGIHTAGHGTAIGFAVAIDHVLKVIGSFK